MPGEHAIYNLGSGTGFSVREVVEACRTVTGRPIPADVVPRRAGDPAVLVASSVAATEALAAVDTICVDKTGTLTDGTLKLIGVVAADPDRAAAAERALGTFAASAGERNRTLETIAERYPAHPERPSAEVPFSSQWKWSGMSLNGTSYVIGAPDVLAGAGALRLREGLQRALDEHTYVHRARRLLELLGIGVPEAVRG